VGKKSGGGRIVKSFQPSMAPSAFNHPQIQAMNSRYSDTQVCTTVLHQPGWSPSLRSLNAAIALVISANTTTGHESYSKSFIVVDTLQNMALHVTARRRDKISYLRPF
jgi:hypothetical protein